MCIRDSLYANHMNQMNIPIFIRMLAINETSEQQYLTILNKSMTIPSQYPQISGSEATVDWFIQQNKAKHEQIEILAYSTIVLHQSPMLIPQYAYHFIYDVNTSKPLTIQFTASTEPFVENPNGSIQKQLPFTGHIRGGFDKSELYYHLNLQMLQNDTIGRVTFGDNKADVFIGGYDPTREQSVLLKGNFGVNYSLKIRHSKPYAVLMMARGGSYKGAFYHQQEIIKVPKSGTLTPFKQAALVTRIYPDSSEMSQLQWIPPAGSSLPIELYFIPLNE